MRAIECLDEMNTIWILAKSAGIMPVSLQNPWRHAVAELTRNYKLPPSKGLVTFAEEAEEEGVDSVFGYCRTDAWYSSQKGTQTKTSAEKTACHWGKTKYKTGPHEPGGVNCPVCQNATKYAREMFRSLAAQDLLETVGCVSLVWPLNSLAIALRVAAQMVNAVLVWRNTISCYTRTM